jgi:transcriptional regulator with XRE-family HTH domain
MNPITPITWLADLEGKPAAHELPVALPPSRHPSAGRPLQRLGEVRRREGVTRREVARRLHISIREVEEQEQPSTDVPLSDLYRWQEILQVPLAELLSEPSTDLSPPLQLRSRLLRAMKTIRSMQEVARQASVQRLATMLVEQILEIMPELKATIAWPSVGHRRKQTELGQAFYRGLGLHDDSEGSER